MQQQTFSAQQQRFSMWQLTRLLHEVENNKPGFEEIKYFSFKKNTKPPAYGVITGINKQNSKTHNKMNKKAIFFPTEAANVPAHVNNINTKILAPLALGAKYDWTVDELAELLDHNTKIPTDITAAEAAMQTAQGLNETKDNRIHKCELFLNKKGRDMQGHADYDSADLEALGMFVIHTPPNPDEAKPTAKATVMPDMVRVDWVKGPWGGVLVWTSYNGTTWSANFEKDLRSPWEDTRPNQQAGVAEFRYYKLRYIDKTDTPIGLETIIKVVVNIE